MKIKSTLFGLCIFCFFSSQTAQASHPIFILLTHARATATAFEKVMRTKENLTVLHAPFLDSYLVEKYGSDDPAFTRCLRNPYITFGDITQKLFKLAEEKPVFFKESGYLLIDFLKKNPDLYNNPQVKMVIFVRDPAKSVLSFYKKMPTVSESIVGHKQLWELFEFLRDVKGEPPLVIDSDEFLKHPLYILDILGNEWGLQFDETNLKWTSGYADDWHVKDWYVEVASSTALEAYRGDVEREEDGTPKYLEVTDEQQRQRLQALYHVHNVYYQKLLRYAVKPKRELSQFQYNHYQRLFCLDSYKP